MSRFFKGMRNALFVLTVLGSAGSQVLADYSLVQYEFLGQPGTETFVAPSYAASGLSALNFTESGVTSNLGSNSINSAGWNNPAAYYQFGFTIQPGQSVTVDQIILTSRSSNTGPGFISLLASVDGGAFTSVASITQTGTAYNDEFLSITPVTALNNLTFQFVATNQTSAGGATIGSSGTFRIGDYNPAGSATPFTINGTINQSANVPEPASISLVLLGGLGVGAFALRRRKNLQGS